MRQRKPYACEEARLAPLSTEIAVTHCSC